jgi:peptidoglycan hydrolase-like protein with peptidoglycan-binding domain
MPSSNPRRVLPKRFAVHLTGRKVAGVAAIAASAGAVTAANASADMSYLYQGSHGPAVAKMQRALHVRADGKFTKGTRRAVIGFQRLHGLIVDGIVGPQTWDTLFHITPPPTPTTTTPTTTSSSTYSSSSSGSYSSESSSSSSYSGAGGYSIPSGIVQCESGGNYSAVNSSSGAGGAYQILPSTWQAYGGQGLPQNASKSEQDRIAGEIYARQGGSAWAC